MTRFEIWLAKRMFRNLRQEFYEDLAEALEDKAALAAEIEKLADRAAKERDMIAPLYQLWSRRMDDRSFALALDGTVPKGDVMILHAAEEAGKLPEGLRFISLVIAATKKMKAALTSAVAGFLFLSAFLIALLTLFSFYGIGIIEEVIPPKDWPWIGQALRDVAHFVTDYGAVIGGLLLALTSAYTWSLPNWRGSVRVQFDRYLPFYTIYRDFQGALFLVSLAALMRNKVSLNEALETLEKRASPWLRWHIRQILLRLDYDSDEPGKAFATGIFGRRLTWRIIDFGARSSFPIALEKVGLKSIDTVTDLVTRSAGKINKTLLVVSGLMMAFIIAGTVLTMYEAQNSLQRQMTVSTPK